MKVTHDGLDEITKGLEAAMEKIAPMEGKPVPMETLITPDFMKSHTRFQSFQEMVDASGLENEEDLSSPKWSAFVAANTDFRDWDKMLSTAFNEYIGLANVFNLPDEVS